MYVPMGPMLNRANEHGYAVLAVNALSIETMMAIIAAAEEAQAPIIIDLYQEHLRGHVDFRYLLPAAIELARESFVPVAVNLDHGKDPGYVRRAIHGGFLSVMMDASESPYEQNLATVRDLVQFARPYGVSVEAELGGMGAVAGGKFTSDAMFTDPDQAEEFVAATGVDALAVSYGSSHGTFPDGYVPEFRFDVLDAVKKKTGIPLVLHGGSGSGTENLRRSVELGINKINMGADFMRANVRSIQNSIDTDPDIEFMDVLHGTLAAGADLVLSYLGITRSEGQANRVG